MTESPKPLSPGSGATRQASHHDGGHYHSRSSSITAQLQQHRFGRGGARQTPPASSMSMPPAGGPQLPPPAGLNPPDSRFTLPSQGGPTHPPTQPSGPPTHMGGSVPLSSHSNSLASHAPSGHSAHSAHSAHSGPGSGDNAAPIFGQNSNDRLWTYVKSLEQRINGLQDEVSSLRGQLSLATQPQPRPT